jgi:NADH-quinone oxidoreductase subunit E
VDRQAIVEIAQLLELHPAQVQDTMSFYAFFKESPDSAMGKDRVWVCRGLACMLRGAYELLEDCEKHYGVHCGERTTDGRLTLEFAECIGACDGAPAVLINDEHLHQATVESIDTALATQTS